MPNNANRPGLPVVTVTPRLKSPGVPTPPSPFQRPRTPPAPPRAAATAGRPAAAPVQSKPANTGQGPRLNIMSQVTTARTGRRVTAAAGGTEIGSLEVRAAAGGAEVVNLKVKPQYRHQGAGAALIAEAARAAAQMGRVRLTLEAQDSGSGRLVSWYRRLGFVPTGTSQRGYTKMAAPVSSLQRQTVQRAAAGHGVVSRPHAPQPPPRAALRYPTARVVQRAAVNDVQVDPLKRLVQSQRQEIQEIARTNNRLTPSDRDALEACEKRLVILYGALLGGDPMSAWDAFITWTDTSIWDKGGQEYWETYVALRPRDEPVEKKKEAVKFSSTCDAIFSDMNAQFAAWDGTLTNRGAWWGSARPGSTTGARSVPQDVITELKKKAAGSGWRFSDSFSGGLSFHRTRGSIDFIYHMQSPG
jgi:Acetyltransferase (GNAT) domain